MKQMHKVLVVDDDPTTRFLIVRTIKRVGISNQILTAANGEEALALLVNIDFPDTYPDLILLDINMPLMDGFDFLEAIQQSNLAPLPSKIVLLSSSANPQDLVRASKYLVADYLAKPLTDDSLRSIMA